MSDVALEALRVAQKVATIFDATMRYWAIYKAAADSSGLKEFVFAADIEANGVVIVRSGMIRLTVLNLRRVLEPAQTKKDRLNLLRLLELLPKEGLRDILADPSIAGRSGLGTIDRRIAEIEFCRRKIVDRHDSEDAKWVWRLRDHDIAHAAGGSAGWDERSLTQLHQFVMETADEGYRLCDAISACHQVHDAYDHAYSDATAFWSCFGLGHPLTSSDAGALSGDSASTI